MKNFTLINSDGFYVKINMKIVEIQFIWKKNTIMPTSHFHI